MTTATRSINSSMHHPREKESPLRSTIQIELNYAMLRLPRVELPVASFVAKAFSRAPQIPALACVSVTETAAEKLDITDATHGHGDRGVEPCARSVSGAPYL